MHVAASAPRWISSEDIPEDLIAKEKEIYMTQAKEAGKPDKILEKIADGKLKKFFSENCLLLQAFVKDTDKTVDELVKETIAKLGENITVGRMARFEIGKE